MLWVPSSIFPQYVVIVFYLEKDNNRFCIVLIQKVISGIQIEHLTQCAYYFCTYYWPLLPWFLLILPYLHQLENPPPPSCPHMHLLFGLEAQMYIHLILVPAVKLQRGLKDPPHSPLRKGLQETHTHTYPYIHNGWSKTLQETAQGNSCQARADYFPPYFLFLCSPPRLPSPLLSTPRSCVCILSSSSWGYCTDLWRV